MHVNIYYQGRLILIKSSISDLIFQFWSRSRRGGHFDLAKYQPDGHFVLEFATDLSVQLG